MMSPNNQPKSPDSKPNFSPPKFQPDLQTQIDDVAARAAELANKPPVSAQVNLSDVLLDMRRPVDKARGIFSVVSTAPSAAPTDAWDQIRIYTNGGTLRLYWYDWNAATWHYVTATA